MSRLQQLRARIPAFTAVVVAVAAVGVLLATVLRFMRPVRDFLSDYYFWFVFGNPAMVVMLLLLAAALRARKRIAWWGLALAMVPSIISAVYGVQMAADGHYFDLLPAIVSLALQALFLTVVVWGMPEFYAKVRPGNYVWSLALLVGGLLLTLLVAWLLVTRFPGSLHPADSELWVVIHVFGLGVIDQYGLYEGRPPMWIGFVVGLLHAVVLIGSVLLAMRSQRSVNSMTSTDEHLLRALIERWGSDDSLAYFATRRDKSVIFSPDGLAAVTYRVEAAVCLASGDPIGNPGSWDEAVEVWLRQCRTYGWTPAAMGASATGAETYAAHGLEVLELGDEAVLPTEQLRLRGPEHAALRQSISRARRAGLSVRIRRHRDIPTAELRGVGYLVEHWRDTRDERGFSMALGRWADGADGNCLLVEAVTEDNATVGVLSFAPWGRSAASLDVMRRSKDAPNGTTELMVSELCARGTDFGLSKISLNFAAFRESLAEGGRLGASPMERSWHRLLMFASRWWQLDSLYRANQKYHPTWMPRYLVFNQARHLPRIAFAAGVAEGFVSLPGLGALDRRHTATATSRAPISPAQLPPKAIEAPERRPEQVEVRMTKARQLLDAGIDPWPEAAVPTHDAASALAAPDGAPITIAGRLMAERDLGGVAFLDLSDWSGRIQIILDAAALGDEAKRGLDSRLDLGDLVHVEGVRGASRRGEPSVLASAVTLNAKCLHPLPDKRKGLADPEARVRQRHLDLATNERSRQLMVARAAVLQSLRTSLYERGFLEVETPILQAIHGGANARPFETHINAYDMDLYLRIAPELYLKRLCVGGMTKVFEIGRAFRNEGVDYSHNPEFTILEAYEAHGDYLTMMRTCREMIQAAAIAANGECVVPGPDGNPVDISGEWPVVTLHEAVSAALVRMGGDPIHPDSNITRLRHACALADVECKPAWDAGEIALELYEHLVEGQTREPTFYCDFPTSVSPLTRSHRSTEGVTERWDLVAFGMELGTAYSELTDPLEQRRRLTEQSLRAADGDPEAMELDEDFLQALECGMPPTGGLGMGVDRVVMLITGSSIRDTLPFPLTKPRE